MARWHRCVRWSAHRSAAPRPELNAHIDPRANCTHLHDLALLAVGHALRAEPACRYEICIPDAREGRTLATLERDGVRLLGWEMREGVIETPALYAGQAALGGFTQLGEGQAGAA